MGDEEMRGLLAELEWRRGLHRRAGLPVTLRYLRVFSVAGLHFFLTNRFGLGLDAFRWHMRPRFSLRLGWLTLLW